MYGIEKYAADAQKAGIVNQLKAEKFEEIRDAARDLAKAEKALKAANMAYSDAVVNGRKRDPALLDAVKNARQDVGDYRFILNRFTSRAAEGDL